MGKAFFFLKAQLDSVAPAHHFSSLLYFLQGLWHSLCCVQFWVQCFHWGYVASTFLVPTYCVPVYMIANVKVCQSSWPYGTHGSAAVCRGTSRLQYMVNTPDWSILYLECTFTTSHVPVLMLTCTHTPTYTISLFFFSLKVGHTAIGLSLVVGQEGEGVGALKHTCLSKDAPLLTDHWGGELVCQSCRKLNWLWQVESSRASEHAFELFLSAVLLSGTWIVSIFYFRSRESSCNFFSEAFDETIHMNVYYTGVQYISSNSRYFF